MRYTFDPGAIPGIAGAIGSIGAIFYAHIAYKSSQKALALQTDSLQYEWRTHGRQGESGKPGRIDLSLKSASPARNVEASTWIGRTPAGTTKVTEVSPGGTVSIEFIDSDALADLLKIRLNHGEALRLHIAVGWWTPHGSHHSQIINRRLNFIPLSVSGDCRVSVDTFVYEDK